MDDENEDSGFGVLDDNEVPTLTIVNSAENWDLLNMSTGINYWSESETNSAVVLGFGTPMDRERVTELMKQSSNAYNTSF